MWTYHSAQEMEYYCQYRRSFCYATFVLPKGNYYASWLASLFNIIFLRFIQIVVTAVICSFSLLCSIPLYECTDNPFYCCCLFGLDIMCIDNAALNILVCVFQYYVHVFLLVLYLEMNLLGHRVCRCSTSVDR